MSIKSILFVHAVFILPLFFPLSTTAQSASPLPFIVETRGENLRKDGPFVDSPRHFGTLEIDNTALSPFILRVTFANGGRVMPWGVAHLSDRFIRLHSLEFRYRNNNNVMLSRVFPSPMSGSSGFVYELRFLPEDVQSYYRMELWGRLAAVDARGAVPAIYFESARFEILGLD